jgi:hypothetical protein
VYSHNYFKEEVIRNSYNIELDKTLSKVARKHNLFYRTMVSKNKFYNPNDIIDIAGIHNVSNYEIDSDYVYTKTHGHMDKDDGNFNYRFNNYSFRSDTFKELKDSDYNVLTSGCSVTFGLGLPEKHLWRSTLLDSIKKNKNSVCHYDTSISGHDSNVIINNLYNFINLFGKPNVIFLSLPPIFRVPSITPLDYKPDPVVKFKDEVKNVSVGSALTTKQEIGYFIDKQAFLEYIDKDFETWGVNIFHNISAIRNFESYCKQLKIKLYWTSWDTTSCEYYSMFEFDNFYSFPMGFGGFYPKNNKDFYQNNPIGDLKDASLYWEAARDGAHFGLKWHYKLQGEFYDEWRKDNV